MEGKSLVGDLERLRCSLEALEQSLMSTARSLDNVATQLENVHLDSSDPYVLHMKEEAQLLINRFRFCF